MRNMTSMIGIIGGGGQADETESFFEGEVAFRAVTKDYLQDGLVDMDNPNDLQGQTPVVVAIGSPGLRRDMTRRWQGSSFASVVSSKSYIDPASSVGRGAIVAPGVVVTTNVSIGEHALLNVGSSIQHNTVIGDFVTVGPGVRIGGNVTLGDGVLVGIGAVIKNGVTIADGVVVGAGAVVVRDLEVVNGVYVGVPTKQIKVNEDWLYEI